jgi:hypothetical protein
MSDQYYPLYIWIQPLDDFGAEIGEPVQTFNLELLHAQTSDRIVNPRYISDEIDSHLKGEWTVQEREFKEHKSGPYCTSRHLTLYVRQR